MKWILILVLIVVIMLIAISVSEQYKDKYDFYVNLKQFLSQLKINIAFKQDKLDKFLSNQLGKKSFKIFIASYKNYLKTNELNLSELKLLDQDEKTELINIVKNIGKFDKTSELNQLDGFLQNVEEKLTQAKQDMTKMCPMIIKLSLLFSLGVAILLI